MKQVYQAVGIFLVVLKTKKSNLDSKVFVFVCWKNTALSCCDISQAAGRNRYYGLMWCSGSGCPPSWLCPPAAATPSGSNSQGKTTQGEKTVFSKLVRSTSLSTLVGNCLLPVQKHQIPDNHR